jgi:predicted thioesterase
VFGVEAHDGHDQIARGTHTRFVVASMQRFIERATEKGASSEPGRK